MISSYLANEGRTKYLLVTVGPMLFVATTTFVAGAEMLSTQYHTLSIQLHNAPVDRNGALH